MQYYPTQSTAFGTVSQSKTWGMELWLNVSRCVPTRNGVKVLVEQELPPNGAVSREPRPSGAAAVDQAAGIVSQQSDVPMRVDLLAGTVSQWSSVPGTVS